MSDKRKYRLHNNIFLKRPVGIFSFSLIVTVLVVSMLKVEAAMSPRMQYLYDVLQSLQYCNWADKTKAEGEGVADVVSQLIRKNQRLASAKFPLEKYLSSKNGTHKTVAQGIIVGTEELIDVNNKILAHLKKVNAGDQKAMQEMDFVMGELHAKTKQGWEMVAVAAPWVMEDIVQPAKDSNPKGPLPFLISKEDRTLLLQKIEDDFGEDLQKYYDYRAGKGNPADQTYLVFAVVNIKNFLVPETYEEAAKLRQGK